MMINVIVELIRRHVHREFAEAGERNNLNFDLEMEYVPPVGQPTMLTHIMMRAVAPMSAVRA